MNDMEKGISDNVNNYQENERAGFARKVYGITASMLAFTTLFTALFYDSTGNLAKNTPIIVLAIVGTFSIIIALTCCGLSEKVPTNYILLALFCLCQSVLLAITCSYYETSTVFIALLLTAMITTVLTLYAWNTKTDVTILNGIMLVVLTGFVFCGLIMLIFNITFMQTVYSFLGACIFGIYIVIDVQMIEGKMKEKYEKDDYVGGALNLYLDILNLFLYILELLGNKKE